MEYFSITLSLNKKVSTKYYEINKEESINQSF